MVRRILLSLMLILLGCGGRSLRGPDSRDAEVSDTIPSNDVLRDVLWDVRSRSTCQAGERMWCSGLMFSGWGLVACDPATSRWRIKQAGGKTTLDCRELSTGEVPATACACHHYYFNPVCCEKPDCVLPAGATGQICPPSKGALCDYCNPLKPECKEPGALCLVTNHHETFCGSDCSAGTCPSGYVCREVKHKLEKTKQCVPAAGSCFH